MGYAGKKWILTNSFNVLSQRALLPTCCPWDNLESKGFIQKMSPFSSGINHNLRLQASLIAQLVKKIHWRRDRLSPSIFLAFPCGSAGKKSACIAGDLGSRPGLGRSSGERERLPPPVFWPGEFHGLYSPWGGKELDTTEWVSLSLSGKCRTKLHIVPLYTTIVF